MGSEFEPVKPPFLWWAIRTAVFAHKDQQDKNGEPYILHPLRVMLKMRTEDEQIVAILHDLIEDTYWTLEALKWKGIPGNILGALDAITRRKDEPYMDYIERVSTNKLASNVKIEDLKDNLRPGCPKPTEYQKAIDYLTSKINI